MNIWIMANDNKLHERTTNEVYEFLAVINTVDSRNGRLTITAAL